MFLTAVRWAVASVAQSSTFN